MSVIFQNGDAIIVTVYGPGKVHLLTYDNVGKEPSTAGSISTKAGVSSHETTRFLISFSHTYRKYAFYFEGNGEAVFGIGQQLTRTSVGKSWSDATLVNWGATTATRGNVVSTAAEAHNRDNVTTCYVIPDRLL